MPLHYSAQVGARAARLICDRLWDFGITPGAATAAARISDALHSHPAMRGDVTFTEREVAPLLDASNLDPLHDTCVEVIDRLTADGQHHKLRALITDLERIRDNLRPRD